MRDQTSIRIVQTSKARTGSTFVVNLIAGLICPDEAIQFPTHTVIENAVLSKCHHKDPLTLFDKFSEYDLYLVVTTRGDKRYDKDVLDHPRVLEIDYDDILETPERSVTDIVDHLADDILDFLPDDVVPDLPRAEMKAKAVERIQAMNRVVAELSDEPFSVYETFFHVHGSHRGRLEKPEDIGKWVKKPT